MTLEAGLATASCPGSAACAQRGVRRRGRSRDSSSRRRVRTSARAVWPTARIGKRVRCGELRGGAGPFALRHDTRSGTIPRCLHGLHGVQRCVQLVVVSLAKFLNDSGTSTSGDTPRPSTTAPRRVFAKQRGTAARSLPHAEIATPSLLTAGLIAYDFGESALLRERGHHLARAQRMLVHQHHHVSVERFRSQTFGHEADRSVTVKNQKPNGHLERVETARGEPVRSRQLIAIAARAAFVPRR